MKLFLVILSVLVIFGCEYQHQDTAKDSKGAEKNGKNLLEFRNVASEVFETNDGWGYDIIIDNKIYIHQTHIPAINGLKTFSSAKDAKKVADFVINKLIKTHRFPSINNNELDSLGVLNK